MWTIPLSPLVWTRPSFIAKLTHDRKWGERSPNLMFVWDLCLVFIVI